MLADRWPLDSLAEVRDELLAAYGSPGRSYHDLRHLTEVLDRLDDLGCDDPPVLLAAWFHDAVYDGAARGHGPADGSGGQRAAGAHDRPLGAGQPGEPQRLP